MKSVDLNCDLGEGSQHDADLMSLISSANIACGGHAGDEETMRTTVKMALTHGVAIGAHPGFPDRANFGRVELPATPEEIHAWVLTQTQRLIAIASSCEARVGHVKPHGALYNMAARSAEVSLAIAEAVHEADPRLTLVGLAGSRLIEAGRDCGLGTLSEVFADRTYQADGSLTPRSRPNSLITDEVAAAQQVLRMVQEGRVVSIDGGEFFIQVDTICLHGDGAHALGISRSVSSALRAAGVVIRAGGRS